MAEETKIAWTHHTFNPWMGCQKVSEGCRNCYAEQLVTGRMGRNLWGPEESDQNNGRQKTKSPWKKVKRWQKKAADNNEIRLVFTGSLCDIFEDAEIPNNYRPQVWDVIRSSPNLHFQLLTKRPQNIAGMLPDDWGDGYDNVWLGCTIERNDVAHRHYQLVRNPAKVHYVSYEPAIGPLDQMPLDDIEWVIYGGESGSDYRDHNIEWPRNMRERCEKTGTAFFYKQSPAYKTEQGIKLDGEIVRNMPDYYKEQKRQKQPLYANG
jgi:protein gp37